MKHLIEQLEEGRLEEAINVSVSSESLQSVLKRKFKPRLPNGVTVTGVDLELSWNSRLWVWKVGVGTKWDPETGQDDDDLRREVADVIESALESALGGDFDWDELFFLGGGKTILGWFWLPDES